MTLEGGQTVAMEIALGDGPSRELSEYVIRIVYADTTGLEIHEGQWGQMMRMGEAPNRTELYRCSASRTRFPRVYNTTGGG